MAVKLPAVTVKLAELLPALTVTEAGTGAAGLLLESETIESTRAGRFSVTVQVDVLPGASIAGLQLSPLRLGAELTVAAPPAPLRGRAVAAGDAAIVLATPTATAPVTEEPRVTASVATTPFCIVV